MPWPYAQLQNRTFCRRTLPRSKTKYPNRIFSEISLPNQTKKKLVRNYNLFKEFESSFYFFLFLSYFLLVFSIFMVLSFCFLHTLVFRFFYLWRSTKDECVPWAVLFFSAQDYVKCFCIPKQNTKQILLLHLMLLCVAV